MAAVSLAAIKIGGVMFGFSPVATILVASIVTVVFSALGGFRAVVLTDLLLFVIAMIGAVAAALVALQRPEVGGLSGLLAHEALTDKLAIFPQPTVSDAGGTNWEPVVMLLIIPLAVQWWSVWYPGSEPGGGGYVAQRMLSAKDERHAVGATFFFQAAHYALRPWPWILVALASLLVFPLDDAAERAAAKAQLESEETAALVEQWEADPQALPAAERARIEALTLTQRGLTSIKSAFPDTAFGKLGHDLAYPAMLTFLPAGLLGLVVASLIAAYMSTISTHLNWGSSYIVNDFWQRFVSPQASQGELVWVGRVATVLLMALAGGVALLLQNAMQAFNILLQIGAGTGLLFILRWFWWRINPYSELAAMVVSFLVAIYMQFGAPDTWPVWLQLLISVGFTTFVWLVVTFITPPSHVATLRRFYALTRPGGPGWRRVLDDAARDGESLAGAEATHWPVPRGILCMVLGCVAVYSALFGTGYWIYGNVLLGGVFTFAFVVSAVLLGRAARGLLVASDDANTAVSVSPGDH